jgi:CelD/BcsL family acetyltransferase involved in cellulose biosynthesis
MYSTRVEALSPELVDLWSRTLVAASPDVGPFLHPEFVRAVSAVRDNVEVGVLELDGAVRGFLPFQRGRWGIARPVAGRLCDQSGAVLAPGANWDPRDFARAVGLRAIRFANAPVGDAALGAYQDRPKTIFAIDMTGGFESYRAQNLETGSRFIRQIESRTRKAEKEFGPMRFVWHTDDDAVLATLLQWKAAQRRLTGTPNVFDLPWARALVERLRRTRVDGFEGILSAVYFGDTLAAAHFGIRSSTVLQYWVPGYNEALGRHSPGLACLMAVSREASKQGVVRVDLGVGEQRFKVRAANATRHVATATVRTDRAVGALLSTVDRVRSWARTSSRSQLIHRVARAVARGSYRAHSRLP